MASRASEVTTGPVPEARLPWAGMAVQVPGCPSWVAEALQGAPGLRAGAGGQGSAGLWEMGLGRRAWAKHRPGPGCDLVGGVGAVLGALRLLKNEFVIPSPGLFLQKCPSPEFLWLHRQRGPAAGVGSASWAQARASPGRAGAHAPRGQPSTGRCRICLVSGLGETTALLGSGLCHNRRALAPVAGPGGPGQGRGHSGVGAGDRN